MTATSPDFTGPAANLLPDYPAPPPRLRGLVAAYFGIQFVLNFANGAVTQFMLPLSVDVAGSANKVVNLGVISTTTAVTSLLMLPLAGWLSDSTRSRWGRRAPWMLGGLAGAGLAIGLFALAATIPAMLVLAVSLTISYSAAAAPLFAVLADRTQPAVRGRISAVGGIGMWAGILLGVLTGTAFSHNLSRGYLVLGTITLVAGVPLALSLRRDSHQLPPRTGVSLRTFVMQFWISPRKHPDFAWAFFARVAMFAGYTSISAFMLYTLQDYLGLSRDEAVALVPLITLVSIVALLVSTYPGGWLSDRLGRRKPLVIAASILIAAASLVPVWLPTVPAFVASFAVVGLGFGVYLSVDQALMTMVLPDHRRLRQGPRHPQRRLIHRADGRPRDRQHGHHPRRVPRHVRRGVRPRRTRGTAIGPIKSVR